MSVGFFFQRVILEDGKRGDNMAARKDRPHFVADDAMKRVIFCSGKVNKQHHSGNISIANKSPG